MLPEVWSVGNESGDASARFCAGAGVFFAPRLGILRVCEEVCYRGRILYNFRFVRGKEAV